MSTIMVADEHAMNYVQAPERTLAQRLEALDRANVIRMHRAQLKRDLKAGRKGLADVLSDPLCETMKLFDALVALPKYGRVKANVVLNRARISPSKTVGGLTQRQREELASRLQSSAWRPEPTELARAA
jgi:hypothetical protein